MQDSGPWKEPQAMVCFAVKLLLHKQNDFSTPVYTNMNGKNNGCRKKFSRQKGSNMKI
ncbi:hypothetical protein DC3_41170 [Deinococcus cellulosilyticus NBRC 106333 = KACC 11606]|uniref:Uncharacterized protein n=1 Tax=Deinococcus cellulosilyticus (strain DSM 18568 / NBRC 106333 / KACC 11606 / 5516J-15) TaxID=1223518 RepID=A0A511N6I3_DEIC1|nr:hypothetical protein DC3_41170 [Deinococcus cellulosilyticus NBRC 106333 = KACC 11606]